MEVHAHTHPSTSSGHQKRWTHYLWEFLMLFLAVFCGFLAENKREHMIEHNRAEKYAKQLLEEIRIDTLLVNKSIEDMKLKQRYADSLLFYMSQDSPGRWKKIYFFCSNIDAWGEEIIKVAFEQIKNTGSLRYFSNDMANAFTDYALRTSSLEGYNKYIVEFNDNRLSPFLGKNFDMEIISYLDLNNYSPADFDSIWAKSEKPGSFLSGEKNAQIEFKNFLIVIKSYASIQNYFRHFKRSASTLSEIIKKEYHLK